MACGSYPARTRLSSLSCAEGETRRWWPASSAAGAAVGLRHQGQPPLRARLRGDAVRQSGPFSERRVPDERRPLEWRRLGRYRR